MSRHILFISGIRPDYKYKTHGAFIQQQAETLCKYGHKIGMIYIGMRSVFTIFEGHIKEYSTGKIQEISNPYFTELQLKSWFIGGIPFLREMHYKRLADKLIRHYIDRFGNPDFIHAHFAIWPGVIAYNLSKKYNIPYFLTEHSTAYSRNHIKPKYKYLLKKALDNALCVVCVSEGLKKSVKKYSINENFEVVGNIVKTDFFLPQENNFSGDDYRIFSLGYLTEKKGFDLLIRAFGNLINKNSFNQKVKLIIGGSGPEKENLEKIILEYKIQDSVVLLGELNQVEVKEQLQIANIFALASRHETFGIVFIEAMSCGLPVIATKTDGPIEFVNENVGYLVDIDDIENLEKAIVDAVNRKDYWKGKANNIRKFTIANFSEIEFSKKMENLYSRYLTQRRILKN